VGKIGLMCRTLAIVLASASTAASQETAINLMAGPDGSTAKAIVEDIADLARECGLNPVVNDTAGALDNLLAVKNRRFTQFGLIQAWPSRSIPKKFMSSLLAISRA